MRRFLVVVISVLLVGACVSADDEPNTYGTWVGTITTEGNVTTVVNESGSVWGGTARLVEEASIGVDIGPPEYMLGGIGSLYATDDEIYVVDTSVSMVRVYDFAGTHLRSFGGDGKGPGEFGGFRFGLSVGSDGRVYVRDRNNRRISIYTPEGETLGDIPLPTQMSCCSAPLVFADGGGIWVPIDIPDQDARTRRTAVRVYTADGPAGEPVFVPEIEYDKPFVSVRGRDVDTFPFAARVVWTFGYDQSLIAGASDRYAFRMIRPNGETIFVERFWEPAPIAADEADYWRRFTIAHWSDVTDFSWNGENFPDHKPAYLQLLSSASGELWVWREGGAGLGVCDDDPETLVSRGVVEIFACLQPNMIVDAFDRDGRYLGEVVGLQRFGIVPPFIAGDTVIAEVEDEAGTIMVKRYRLVLPGEMNGSDQTQH